MKCTVCDSPLRADNRYGICNRTLECRRKKGLLKYYRYQESQQSRAKEYWSENRDEMNRKYREWYARQRHKEVTYLAWSPGLRLVKIGITTGLKMRFKAIKTGCPDVVLLGTLPCGRPLERYLHTMLVTALVSGEWFNLGSDPTQVMETIIGCLHD